MNLNFSNFLSFGDNVNIDIPPGVTLIRGNNGVGKSGLLEGFTYAIWGKARGTSEFPGGDHLVRDGVGSMSVGLEFTTPNQIRICRGRDNGNTKLNINICGADQQFVTLDNGEKIINDVVGMGYDTFIKTAYFQQGKDKAFSELTSTESRKKVVEMLGLDRWQEKQTIVLQKLDEIKKQISKYKIIIDAMDGKTLLSEIEKAQLKIKEVLVIIDNTVFSIVDRKGFLMSAQSSASVLLDKINAISTQAALEEEKQNTLIKIKSELEEYTQKIWNLRKQLKISFDKRDTINIKIKALETKLLGINIETVLELQERDKAALISYRNVLVFKKELLRDTTNQALTLEKQRDNLDTCGIECPILGMKCEMLNKDKIEHRTTMLNEKIGYLELEILALGVEINSFQNKILIYENNINKFESIKIDYKDSNIELNTLMIEKKGIDDLVVSTTSNVENINTLMCNANTKHASVSIEIEQIRSGMKIINDLRQEYNKINADILKLTTSIKEKEDYKKELENVEASNVTIININNNKLKELESISIKYDENIYEQHIYDILAIAFGPNGVPAMQIEAMKDQIEVFANNILQYGGQKVSVSILLKEPKKSGDGVKDVFKILVKNGDKILPLFRFSGGESYWIDLSIRAALFLVWRVRNPDNVLDLLMVDEGMGKIDDEKRRVLIDVLKYLSTKVKRILIITHTDLKNLVEEFDNVITIKKINDVSGVG